jgi:hypothetical protein
MRIYRQAETFALLASGPPIQWTDEQNHQKEQLKKELLRREHEGEIGALDAKNPQSMTDANQAYSDLFYDPDDHMIRRPV